MMFVDTVRIKSNKTKIIAHRGLSGIERENTHPAFVAAANRSYYGIETDVHVTKDGKFVVIHDENTQRVSLGKYNIDVEKSRYSKIKKIVLPDADGSFDRKDIRIPLLVEYIKICKKYGKTAVLEIKNHFEMRDIKRLIKEIEKENYIENVIFISFDFENCINVRKLLSQNSVQLITKDSITPKLIDELSEHNLDVDVLYKKLTAKDIELLHSNGIRVNCWTCDDKAVAQKLISYGIDFITTNILE